MSEGNLKENFNTAEETGGHRETSDDEGSAESDDDYDSGGEHDELMGLDYEVTENDPPAATAAADPSSFHNDEDLAASDYHEDESNNDDGDGQSSDEDDESDDQTEIEHPLASMMPEEYKDMDVKLFFPEFKKNKVLRFSRLFGPGKPSSMPRLWRGVRSRRKDKSIKSASRQQSVDAQASTTQEDGGAASVKKEGEISIVKKDGEEEPLTTTTAAVPSAPISAEKDEVSVKREDEQQEKIEVQQEDKDNVEQEPPEEDLYETDDELKMMKPEQPSQKSGKNRLDNDESNKVSAWRYGPAAYWYDQMGVSASGEGFNYNMKVKPKPGPSEISGKSEKSENSADKISPELFLPLNLIRWEDNVIWDGEDVRQEVVDKLTSGRQPLCGWIPTQQTRTYESFMTMLKSGGFAHIFGNTVGSLQPPLKNLPPFSSNFPITSTMTDSDGRPSNFCIFPPDNLELIYGDWEKDVIIDPQNMERIPEPIIPTVDLCDDPLLYGIPEDMPKDDMMNTTDEFNSSKASERKDHQFTKKSQMILGRVAQRQREEEEEAANVMVEKDPYNLSCDEHYLPRSSTTVSTFGGSMIQHSIPAQNLMQPFFLTYWSVFKLRHFHRLPLKKFGANRSVLARPGFHPVQSLESHVQRKAALREQERLASGGGEMFFMRQPEDLSGKDGELILAEYSEEHPPLVMQPGMATKIKNFYKRKPGKDNTEPKFEYGETSYTHTSPFLGSLQSGETLQALENNLFRAPIYRHHVPETDFLIIRDRNGYSIRHLTTMYAVGQECPLYDVPSPNSKRSSNFVRDYLLVFIYRLFWQSKETPRRIKMEDIRQAFPHYAESTIRKRLKICSDFKRMGQGPESNYWVLRSDFRLPDLEEVRSMVSPEMCCAYFSMLAAEQLLKDAGYGERYFFAPEEDEDDNEQMKMADEIKCAPWNTTRAYISAMKGKCLLDLTGFADPTGCSEGFSYVRVTSKPPKDELPTQPKRTVTGTDADLRKLSLKDAKQLLKEFGVKDDEIKTLTRWEIIDVIRTLSTQQARSGGPGITKFARGSMRYSVAEVQDRYKQECQRIFDLQNRVLSSTEYLSTDEEESEGDSDIEEMGKNIETMLANKKPTQLDDEKAEREELKRFLRAELEKPVPDSHLTAPASTTAEGAAASKKLSKKQQQLGTTIGELEVFTSANMPENDGRKLKIYRTRTDQGREYVNVEVITKPQLIEAYLKIRTTKDEAFIKHFAQMDEQYKEEKRREKRRLQDQLRRIRRNELKAQMGLPLGRPPKKVDKPRRTPPPPKPSLLKMRCSACGGNGHMKTNKNCPLYGRAPAAARVRLPSLSVALTDEQIEREFELTDLDNLTSIEGTKIKLSRAIVERTEKMKKKALKLKFPKHVMQYGGGAVVGMGMSIPGQSALAGGSFKKKLKTTITAVETAAGVHVTTQFGSNTPSGVLLPTNQEAECGEREPIISRIVVPKYEKGLLPKRSGPGRPKNPALQHDPTYVGPSLSGAAGPKQTVQRRRTDPKITISLVFEHILNDLKANENSKPFVQSVSKKFVPDYYKIIKRPMDLQIIKMNLAKNHYLTREEFLKDMQQILDNSRLYNGDQHPITQSARALFELALKCIAEREQKLMKLEKMINPLLDDNDLVAFCFILDRIVQECKRVPKSFIFHHPVDKKKYKTYYEKIVRPMDLGTMELKCKRHQYESVNEFVRDAEQLYKNCELFNGPASPFTSKAREIMETAHKFVGKNAQHLADLEKRIQTVKQRVLEDMETESHATGASSTAGDITIDRQTEDLGEEVHSSNAPTPAGPVQPAEDEDDSLLQQDLLMSEGEEEMDYEGSTAFNPSSSKQRRIIGSGGDLGSSRDFSGAPGSRRMATGDVAAMDFSALSEQLGSTEGPTSPDTLERFEEPSTSGAFQDYNDETEEAFAGAPHDADRSRSASRSDYEELAQLLDQSSMARSGRLHTDLAMSESDEDGDNDDSSPGNVGSTIRNASDKDYDFSTL